jgi:hypothetical protein
MFSIYQFSAQFCEYHNTAIQGMKNVNTGTFQDQTNLDQERAWQVLSKLMILNLATIQF